MSSCTNGHPMQEGDRFCATCGSPAAPVDEGPVDDEQVDHGAGAGSRWPLIVLAGVVAALASALAVLVLTRDDGSSTQAVTLDAPRATSTTSIPPRPTDRTTATTAADLRRAFLTDLDLILVRSAQSRGQLSDALAGLNECVDPAPVAAQIREIEDARIDEIAQVQQLDPPDSETQELRSTLLTALASSRESDATYYRIVVGMLRCEPIGSAAAAAEVSDRSASDAKRAFVASYNPMAAAYGLRSDWTEDEI